MKNQYFGDINDYRKYGLLRILAGGGELKIGICWMLTNDDGRPDGRRTTYLEKPSIWKQYDENLFDQLKKCVLEKRRNIDQVKHIIPSAKYYTETLSDQRDQRQAYFDEMLERFKDRDLIFFDPDNGLEVPSKPKGRKHSSKYLYWDEMEKAFQQGHSLLIYQHFPREEREGFISRMTKEIEQKTRAAEVHPYRTPHVVLFLVSQEKRKDYFQRRAKQASKVWGEEIKLEQR